MEKYDNGKGWYFRFDDDNNIMSYNYILLITSTWMDQFNTYNPIYFNEI